MREHLNRFAPDIILTEACTAVVGPEILSKMLLKRGMRKTRIVLFSTVMPQLGTEDYVAAGEEQPGEVGKA